MARSRRPTAMLVLLAALILSPKMAQAVGDSRFGMSGYRTWADFDKVGSSWWLNWDKLTAASYAQPAYPYVRMYWRTTANQYTDAQIQEWARTVRSQLGPDAEIWWTASNEPNDRGQANQTPAAFAAGYYQYHKNLKIGDPACKVLGPSILNWSFLSSSVWARGKDWYVAYRDLWAADPTYSAYSTSIQGNPYPPADAFNLHTYDLRGIQGTPWAGPPDWKYLRDETLACYADLQSWPETQNLKIWNTEYGSLRAGSVTDSADTLGGFALWLRQQPFMERWFFFILWTWDGTWLSTVLLNTADGSLNPLGHAHRALSLMGNSEVYNLPYNAAYSIGSSYSRPGSSFSVGYTERYTLGLNFFLQPNYSYKIGQMRGRTYTLPRRVNRVTFNYRATADPASFRLELDAPGHPQVWHSGGVSGDGWADIDLSELDTNAVSLGIYCVSDYTYTGALETDKIQVNNITFWFDDTIETTPDAAKSIADYRRVRLPNVVISAVYPDSFAVQKEDRSAGIIVAGLHNVSRGDRCTVSGDLNTQSGYRVLKNAQVTNKISPGEVPEPWCLNTRASGGGAYGLQPAVIDNAAANAAAAGLSTVGLLVRVAGRVTYADPDGQFYYLDDGTGLSDGSGYTGVRIGLGGRPQPDLDAIVTATGSCYTMLIDGKPARYIRLSD